VIFDLALSGSGQTAVLSNDFATISPPGLGGERAVLRPEVTTRLLRADAPSPPSASAIRALLSDWCVRAYSDDAWW
jgi:hypothetical protein